MQKLMVENNFISTVTGKSFSWFSIGLWKGIRLNLTRYQQAKIEFSPEAGYTCGQFVTVSQLGQWNSAEQAGKGNKPGDRG